MICGSALIRQSHFVHCRLIGEAGSLDVLIGALLREGAREGPLWAALERDRNAITATMPAGRQPYSAQQEPGQQGLETGACSSPELLHTICHLVHGCGRTSRSTRNRQSSALM